MLNTSVTFIMWLGDTQWISYLIADNWLICRLCAQCMISNNNINSGSLRRCVCHYFLQNNVLLTNIIRFSFSDIPNFQGHGKCLAFFSTDNTYLDLDFSGYHKTSSNNCFLLCCCKPGLFDLFTLSNFRQKLLAA